MKKYNKPSGRERIHLISNLYILLELLIKLSKTLGKALAHKNFLEYF